ncbi:MAG: hypothetical protein LBH49_01760 [Puniceicoccales bacterium]|jgi:hypothetical protein|nr:hypothetical protein [Puniceicoccales bacterium]
MKDMFGFCKLALLMIFSLGSVSLYSDTIWPIVESESTEQSYDESQSLPILPINGDEPAAIPGNALPEKPKNFTADDIIVYVKLADIRSFVAKALKFVNSFDSTKLVEPIIGSMLSEYGYPDFKAFDSNYGITCFLCGNDNDILTMIKLNNDTSSIKNFLKANESRVKIVNGWMFFSPFNNIIERVVDISPFVKIASAAEKNDVEFTFVSARECIYELLDIIFGIVKSENSNNITTAAVQLLNIIQDMLMACADDINTASLLFGVADSNIILSASIEAIPGTQLANLLDNKNSTNAISAWTNFIEYDVLSQLTRFNLGPWLDYALYILKLLSSNPLFDFAKNTEQLSKIANVIKASTDGTSCQITRLGESYKQIIDFVSNENAFKNELLISALSKNIGDSISVAECLSWTGTHNDFFTIYDFIIEKVAIPIMKQCLSFEKNGNKTDVIYSSYAAETYDGVTIYEYKLLSQTTINNISTTTNALSPNEGILPEQTTSTSELYKKYIAIVDGVVIKSNRSEHLKELITAIKSKKISPKAFGTYMGTLNPGDIDVAKIDLRSIVENIVKALGLKIGPNYDVINPIVIDVTAKNKELAISTIIDQKTITELASTIISAIVQKETEKNAKKLKLNGVKKIKEPKPSDKKKKIKPGHQSLVAPKLETVSKLYIFNEEKEQGNSEKFIIPIKMPLLHKTYSKNRAEFRA